MPLPDEKHNEELYSAHDTPNEEQHDSDSDSDTFEFPEVPKASVQPSANFVRAQESVIQMHPIEVDNHYSSDHSGDFEDVKQDQVEERSRVQKDEPHASFGKTESKQFVPFISPPSVSSGFISPPSASSGSHTVRHSDSAPSLSRGKSEANVDLQDVLAAAHAAAESAERAAAAARSAASLAQVRINELTKKKSSEDIPDSSSENPFYAGGDNESRTERGHSTEQNTAGMSDVFVREDHELRQDHYEIGRAHV